MHGHHFRPVHNVPIQQWHMMRELAMTDGTLPTTPTVLKDSPATHWWRKNRGLWDLVHLSHLAYQTPAGEYNVTLLSQLVGPIEGVYDATTFLNHNTERYHSYSFVDGREGSKPHHLRRAMPLKKALRELWKPPPKEDTGMCQAEYHYATAVVEDFVPELSQTVMEWLPENCLRDDRFEAARQWDEKTVPKYETLADCRDLNTIVWLGATNVSTSTHYDVSTISSSKPMAGSASRYYRQRCIRPHGSSRTGTAAIDRRRRRIRWSMSARLWERTRMMKGRIRSIWFLGTSCLCHLVGSIKSSRSRPTLGSIGGRAVWTVMCGCMCWARRAVATRRRLWRGRVARDLGTPRARR